MIGRVARRIWAKAMKQRYGANDRSQKLKYHIQTSGRSLHAQEIAFNDIRTTLQALYGALRQLQLAPHQRLRRGDHHAHRGERAPRARDPAHHQQGAGPGAEREPAAGLVHHRGADRPGGGRGADRVPRDLGARRRARRDGADVPALARSRRESLYYETLKHDGTLPDHRRQHLPRPGGLAHRRAAARSSAHHEEKEYAIAARDAFRQRNAARLARARSQRLQRRGARRRQRLRGADGGVARSARWASSRPRSTRSAVSTAGTCSR